MYFSDEGRPGGVACREWGVQQSLDTIQGSRDVLLMVWHDPDVEREMPRPHKLGPFSCAPDRNLKILETGLPFSLIVERQEGRENSAKKEVGSKADLRIAPNQT